MDIDSAALVAWAAERRGLPHRGNLDRLGSSGWYAQHPVPPPPRALQAGRALGWEDPSYPRGLRRLERPPPAVFVRGEGELPAAGRCVAIVGSRRCTAEGAFFAHALAVALARAGAVVVSGLALGVDAAAHEGALEAGGKTLAVLASPVDRPTPRRHSELARRVERCGWLLSERAPGAALRPACFPQRNRLVAAMVRAVIVVEAALPSGTLSTAAAALAIGVDVAAVPGSPLAPASRGANALLRAGATPITSVADALALLGADSPGRPRPAGDVARLVDGLPSGRGSADAWLRSSGLPPPRAHRALAAAAARGWLVQLPGGRWVRAAE